MAQDVFADPVRRLVEGRAFRMLIGGELVGASSGGVLETVDPSTGRALATVPVASSADVDEAVAAAKAAQPAWERLGVRGRRDVFVQLAGAIEDHAEELAMVDAIDGGNPFPAMLLDVRIAGEHLRDWPALALSLTGETVPASSGNLHYTLLKPYGVVGRIIPFNHPALFAISKVVPALVAGNAVILKPAEQTPLSALIFAEIAAEVFPPGVLNVIAGGADTGDALVRHPGVKRVAFTGSIPTAMRIQQRAAQSAIKHLTFELGGKNAMILFPDASLEEVVQGAVRGMNFVTNQGQSCGSTSRVFVHDSLYDAFVDGVRERLEALRVGCAYEEGTDMGPVVTEEQHSRVIDYIESGLRDGARLLTGGGRPDGVDGGFFVRPTLFGDVSMEMKIAREEIFGPVMSVLRWKDYETMIREANGLEFGLTASIWTNDIHLAHRTANLMEAGYIWINDSSTHYWGTPFGGMKNSGLGREGSAEELLSYYELKAVHTILKDPEDISRDLAPSDG